MGGGTRLISLQSALTWPPTDLSRQGDRRKHSGNRLGHDLDSHVFRQPRAACEAGRGTPSVTQAGAATLSDTGY